MTKTKHKALLTKESLLSKRKEATIALIALLLIMLFAQPLLQVLEALKVISFFSSIHTGAAVITAFSLLLMVLFGYWLDRMLKGYVPSFRITLLLLGASLLFLFRDVLFVGYPEPLRFSDGPALSFLHAIYLLLAGQALLYVNHWTGLHKVWKRKPQAADTETKPKEEPTEPHEGFYCDEPLSPNGKDEFGYRSYANRIANELLKTRSEQAFAVGINGKWGSGKTSFMNLMKEKLEEEDIIKLDFDPWNSQSPAAIVQDYFAALRKALAPYHGEVGDVLTGYANTLTRVHANSWTQGLQAFVSTGREDTRTQMEQIKTCIKEIGKWIFVFIDDTDRLDKKEVFEVLRLIRNTGNFPGLFYVVAYDRGYLSNSLTEISHSGFYLEKILQLEVMLPSIDRTPIEKQIVDSLGDMIGSQSENLFDVIDKSKSLVNRTCLITIKSMRDCNRLMNILKINYLPIADNVLLRDSLIIEALRIKYPEFVKHFFESTQFYTTTLHTGGQEHHRQLYLKSSDTELIKVFKDDAYANSLVYKELCQEGNEFKLKTEDATAIATSLLRVFTTGDFFFSGKSREHHTIRNPLRIPIYARYNLGNENVSWLEFAEAREFGLTKLISVVDTWIEKGVDWEAEQVFKLIRVYGSKEDFENIIQAQLHLCRKLMTVEKIGWSLSSTLRDDLISKIAQLDAHFFRDHYGNDDNYWSYILAWFREELKAEDEVMDDLLVQARRQSAFIGFPIEQERMSELSLEKFARIVDVADEYTYKLWRYFYFTENYEKIHEPGDRQVWREGRVYPAVAKEKMADALLKKFPKDFMKKSINPNARNKAVFFIDESLSDVFETYANFHSQMKLLPESPERDEYLSFLDVLAEGGYKDYQEFDFKVLIPQKYIKLGLDEAGQEPKINE